jgi:hypothetical protein
MGKGQWTDDRIAESKMRSLGVEWEYIKDILISDIDVLGSRRNNARLRDQFNDDLSVQYGVALHDGDVFPAIIIRRVLRPGGFKYFVVSGNHRLGGALLLEDKTLDAYVLNTQDEMFIEMLTRSANRWMGERQSKDEAVEHARELIKRFNKSVPEMARLFGLKEEWLFKALRSESIRDSLNELGLDSSLLPKVTLLHIGQLESNHRVFRHVASLASKFQIKGDRVLDIVRAVKERRTEQDMIDTCKIFEDQLREENRDKMATQNGSKKYPRKSTRSRVFTLVNSLAGFLATGHHGKPFTSLDQLELTSPADRNDFKARMKEIDSHIHELYRDWEKRIKPTSSVVSKRRRNKKGV